MWGERRGGGGTRLLCPSAHSPHRPQFDFELVESPRARAPPPFPDAGVEPAGPGAVRRARLQRLHTCATDRNTLTHTSLPHFFTQSLSASYIPLLRLHGPALAAGVGRLGARSFVRSRGSVNTVPFAVPGPRFGAGAGAIWAWSSSRRPRRGRCFLFHTLSTALRFFPVRSASFFPSLPFLSWLMLVPRSLVPFAPSLAGRALLREKGGSPEGGPLFR
jgi:hypothetical protein